MKTTFMLLALVVSGIAAWAQNADHSHVSGVVENSNGEKLVNAVVNFCDGLVEAFSLCMRC